MSKLKWDQTGERFYETGVDRGVLFVWDPTLNSNKGDYGEGVAWNGLSNVNESPSGGEASDIYADNIKYLSLISTETYGATVEAYMYPDEFGVCNGEKTLIKGATVGQQDRRMFGFAFRTLIGNDTEGTNKGYKITLVYGCKATPSEKSHATVNESPEAATLSWTINTTPVEVPDQTINGQTVSFKPTASITIKSTDYVTENEKAALKRFEDYLYGTDADNGNAATPSQLPMPAKVVELLTVGE